MAKTFNPSSDIPSLDGKVIFITGGKPSPSSGSAYRDKPTDSNSGTAGLGAGSIEALANHNPKKIFFSGRNQKSADTLIAKIHKSSPDVDIAFVRCDISSFASVRECAKTLQASTDRLDIFMLNAGIMAVDPSVSVDGYEIQFATNHLGHALLVQQLLPLLRATSRLPGGDVRVINMTSIAYEQAPRQGIDFATLETDQANLGMIMMHKWARYGQSKLAQMLYTDELARHYPEITWVSIHPGVVMTDLFANVDFVTKLPVLLINIGRTTPVEQGFYNQVWASTCEKKKLKNGAYYEPIGTLGKRSTKQAKDEKLAQKLWAWTQEQFGAAS